MRTRPLMLPLPLTNIFLTRMAMIHSRALYRLLVLLPYVRIGCLQ